MRAGVCAASGEAATDGEEATKAGPKEDAWLDDASLLQGKSLGVVDVADGDGQSVGGVSGFGDLGEGEQAGHHELDLLLGGESIAGDGGFDGEGGVLGDGNAGVGGGEQGDSADMAELDGGFGIDGVENFFDGDDVGAVALEEDGRTGRK